MEQQWRWRMEWNNIKAEQSPFLWASHRFCQFWLGQSWTSDGHQISWSRCHWKSLLIKLLPSLGKEVELVWFHCTVFFPANPVKIPDCISKKSSIYRETWTKIPQEHHTNIFRSRQRVYDSCCSISMPTQLNYLFRLICRVDESEWY